MANKRAVKTGKSSKGLKRGKRLESQKPLKTAAGAAKGDTQTYLKYELTDVFVSSH